MKKTSILLFTLSIILFYSCRKEMGKPSWDTHILAPLINASLNINNLIPDSLLQANADSSLKIVYQNDIYKLSMDTLFNIPDTSLNTTYPIPVGWTINPGQLVVSNNLQETTYQLQGAQLRKIIIKSGFVKYTIKSLLHEVTDFVYSIPCATLNGSPFSINIQVPAAVGSSPGVYSQIFDLSGYNFDLTGINHNKINTLFTSLSAKIDTAGQSIVTGPSENLVIENTFYDLIPYYAKGYFGQNTFNIGPSVTNFSLFDRIVDGTVKLEDVNFNLNIENPIGMDSRLFINNLSSINTNSGNSINLSNSIIGSPININRASESNGIDYPTYANFPLNTSNSNIKPMIENLPNKFGYSMQIITNPMGNISGSNDFIYSDKLLKASLDMEIPLSLVANNLTLVDTLNLTVSNNNGSQNVKSGNIILFANNGFPFDASLQFYLLNDANTVVDSLFGYTNTIVEAPLNSSLRVIDKKLTKIVIPISENKMSLLYNTKKVRLKVKFNTSSKPQYIKIYSDYSMDVKLVGDLNYTVQMQ